MHPESRIVFTRSERNKYNFSSCTLHSGSFANCMHALTTLQIGTQKYPRFTCLPPERREEPIRHTTTNFFDWLTTLRLALSSTGLHILLLENWDSVLTGSSANEFLIYISSVYWWHLNPIRHRLWCHEQVRCLSYALLPSSGLATQPPPHVSFPFAFPFLIIHFPLHLMCELGHSLVPYMSSCSSLSQEKTIHFLFAGLGFLWISKWM